MKVKFNKHNITNGETKAKIFYSLDRRGDEKKCVTIYAKDYSRNLGKIFKNEYKNDTDIMSDYFDEGQVTLFEEHPLYLLARKKAEEIRNQRIERLKNE